MSEYISDEKGGKIIVAPPDILLPVAGLAEVIAELEGRMVPETAIRAVMNALEREPIRRITHENPAILDKLDKTAY